MLEDNNSLYIFLNPHPDDVELALSGVIIKLSEEIENTENILIVYITEGDFCKRKLNRINMSINAWRMITNKKISFLKIGVKEGEIPLYFRNILDMILQSLNKKLLEYDFVYIFSPPFTIHPDHFFTAMLANHLRYIFLSQKLPSNIFYYDDGYSIIFPGKLEKVSIRIDKKTLEKKKRLLAYIQEQLGKTVEELLSSEERIYYEGDARS